MAKRGSKLKISRITITVLFLSKLVNRVNCTLETGNTNIHKFSKYNTVKSKASNMHDHTCLHHICIGEPFFDEYQMGESPE